MDFQRKISNFYTAILMTS